MKKTAATVFHAAVKALIKFLDKAASRKWLVWLVATHMTYIALLDPQSWLLVSLILMGVQGALDWKGMPAASIVAGRPTTTTTTDPETGGAVSPVST